MNRRSGLKETLLLLAGLLLLTAGCSDKRELSQLERGLVFVEYHARESYIREKTAFLEIEGEHDVQSWVSFFFSPYSTASWLSETNEFGTVPRGEVYLPDSVEIFPATRGRVLREKRYAIILQGDTSSNELIVRGFDEKVLKIDMRIPFPLFDE